jgi:hypothetical protein
MTDDIIPEVKWSRFLRRALEWAKNLSELMGFVFATLSRPWGGRFV